MLRYFLSSLFLLANFVVSSALDFVLIEPKNGLAPFYVATVPVSQNLFYEIMKRNPSFFRGENLPVESLSWYEALVFCNLLSIIHHLEPVYYSHEGNKDVDAWGGWWGGIPNHRVSTWQRISADQNANGYRMLTHAEWDYLYSVLKNELNENLEKYAWVYTNSDNKTHPIGNKTPDSLGLLDFLGNVYEWRFNHHGDLPERYFRHRTQEDELFYNSLSHERFRFQDFMIIRDIRGLWPVMRNPLLGLRIARSKV